tara:strand:- start:3153 stop:4625 length:1473 start_codon:yes stop_codon:yes gene_type:complete
MKKSKLKICFRLLKCAVYLGSGATLGLLVVGIYVLNNKPDLKVWHTAKLDAEFTCQSDVDSFEDYLALEEKLFAQLNETVYDKIDAADKIPVNRYHRGSLSDPANLTTNWNRTFELAPDSAIGSKAAVLLLHGLSDSPYSLRSIGERLQANGVHVLGLRIPGHGTAPSALTRTRWEDMAAAVEIAVGHLRESAPDRPLYLIGYSNGGALAVHYVLSTIENAELPKINGIVLLSPEIGITPTAAMAIWQERIGRLLGLDKLAWTGVAPEYDPYKYTSFSANAGNLAYEITKVNRGTIARLGQAGQLDSFPPVLAFQSMLDSTITASSLVQDLFDWLPANGHELVIFDLNRNTDIEVLLKHDPKPEAIKLLDNPDRSFVLTVLTNATKDSEDLVARTWAPGQSTPAESGTGLSWPEGIYSLAHVALPFPENDPVYGGAPKGKGPGIRIGTVAMRGEKGALHISAQDMLRLRWNPFHSYLEKRVTARLGLEEP